MKKILLSLFLAAVSLSSYAQHFITDPNFRQKVENAFQAKMKVIGKKFYNTKGLRVSPEEEEALRFLYAYMPIADATDYPTAYHLKTYAPLCKQESRWHGERMSLNCFSDISFCQCV